MVAQSKDCKDTAQKYARDASHGEIELSAVITALLITYRKRVTTY